MSLSPPAEGYAEGSIAVCEVVGTAVVIEIRQQMSSRAHTNVLPISTWATMASKKLEWAL